MSVHCQANDEVRLPRDRRVLVFRLVRELLLNVVKHAEVDEARLEIRPGEEGLWIDVQDDGKGFEPGELQDCDGSDRGMDLQSVERRLDLFEGSLTIDSAPADGTTATLFIPWRSEKGTTER